MINSRVDNIVLARLNVTLCQHAIIDNEFVTDNRRLQASGQRCRGRYREFVVDRVVIAEPKIVAERGIIIGDFVPVETGVNVCLSDVSSVSLSVI